LAGESQSYLKADLKAVKSPTDKLFADELPTDNLLAHK
jgi:hypothetical protein